MDSDFFIAIRGVYIIETLEQMLHPRNRGKDFSVCVPPLMGGKEG